MKRNRRKNIIRYLALVCIMVMLLMPTALSEHTAWDCPECGRTGNTGNYCGGCAHPAPWLQSDTQETEDTASWRLLLEINCDDLEGLFASVNNGGEAQYYFENGMYVLDILNPGPDTWSVQIANQDFQLIKGAVYELSWDMKCSTDREVEVIFQHYEGDWDVYLVETFQVTQKVNHYTWQFTMTEETDTTPQLAINLGKLDSMTGTEAMKRHQVYTDNIQLKVLEAE